MAECIIIVQEEEKPRFRRLPLTTVTWNERDDQGGAPIWVSKCDSDRWTGAAIAPTKGAEYRVLWWIGYFSISIWAFFWTHVIISRIFEISGNYFIFQKISKIVRVLTSNEVNG